MIELQRISRIHKKGELERAEREYLRYLKAHPDCLMARAMLAECKLHQGYWGIGYEYARDVIERNADFEESYGDIIVACRKLGRIDEAIEFGYKALKKFGEKWDRLHGKGKMSEALAQMAANVMNNLGSTLMEMGRYPESEQALARALTYRPEHPDANWNLGLVRLGQGKWDGWAGYEYGFRCGERKGRPYCDEYEPWKGQDLKGKTILVWGEQGVGDEILFAQCLPDLKRRAKKVIFDCHPRLRGLFEQSFPGIVCQGTRKEHRPGLFDDQRIDYHIALGNLPVFFRQADEHFRKEGYLRARPKEVRKWREQAPGFRVGLAWSGGSSRTGQKKRSMPLETLLGALEVRPRSLLDDVKLISLQYGDGTFEQVDAVRKCTGVEVLCHEGAIEDFQQQADLTASCDLVISVVQTTVHLAGALDVPTMCLVPYGPPWKFPPGRTNPWHPSVTQYRQPKLYDWYSPLAEIRSDLETMLKTREAEKVA